jgi:group I intron endonuclease
MKLKPGEAAIYSITHIASCKCYVGSTIDPLRRFADHKTALKKGNHIARRLQNSWKKYGQDAFVFQIIEVCKETERAAREQQYIDDRRPFFNWARTVASPSLDPRVAKQISRAMRGNQNTKGLIWSDKARANMSKAVKGKPRSAAQRAATLRSLELARQNARVNKPGMNWRLLRRSEGQGNLFE